MRVKQGCLDQWYSNKKGMTYEARIFRQHYPSGIICSGNYTVDMSKSNKANILVIEPHGNEYRMSRVYMERVS